MKPQTFTATHQSVGITVVAWRKKNAVKWLQENVSASIKDKDVKVSKYLKSSHAAPVDSPF